MRVAIAALKRATARWRIPAPLDREDLVQEVCARWLARCRPMDRACQGPVLLALLGIFRNVLRECIRQQRAHAEKVARLAARNCAADCGTGGGAREHQDLREAWLRWLRRYLPAGEAAIVVAVRWDGLSWNEACEAHGWGTGRSGVALQRKISRFLSDPEVQKSLLQWLRALEIESPFPSLPFPDHRVPWTPGHLRAPCRPSCSSLLPRSVRQTDAARKPRSCAVRRAARQRVDLSPPR